MARMQVDAHVLDLIRNLYEAASDPARWPDFLKPFMAAVGGNATALVRHSFRNLSANLSFSLGFDPAWQVRYEQYFASRNTWLLQADPALFAPGVVGMGQQAIEDSELRKTEFYNDYLAPQGFLHTMGGTIRRDTNACCYLTAMGPCGNNPFGAREVRLFEALMPHLDCALKIHERLAGLESHLKTALDLLDRFSHGVLLLDCSGKLRFMNRAAETLLHSGDGLAWTRDGLVVSDAKASSTLRNLIRGAIETASRNGMMSGGLAVVPRPSLRRAYEVLVAPLPAASRLAVQWEPGVIVFLSDPEQQPLPEADAVRALFDLTAAEARIAIALVRGKNIEEAAEEFGVTVNTARTQVKSMLSKTGVRRQSELVRLLMTSLARCVR